MQIELYVFNAREKKIELVYFTYLWSILYKCKFYQTKKLEKSNLFYKKKDKHDFLNSS